MNKSHAEYWDALQRLIENKPVRVTKGVKISNKSVALEAGRSAGSIKKGRGSFAPLIEAISHAESKQSEKRNAPIQKLQKEKIKSARYRDLLHQALTREIVLYDELVRLERKLNSFENVVPLFDKNRL